MKQRGGYILIELVLVLLLLVLVATSVFVLAATGSEAYLNLNDEKDKAADLRTGLSYLDVKVRKHDAQDALSIQPDPFNAQPALVIAEDYDGRTYLTWIYLRDGYLCELFIAKDAVITEAMGSKIVAIDGLKLEPLEDGALRITLSRLNSDQTLAEGSRTICLNAGGIS